MNVYFLLTDEIVMGCGCGVMGCDAGTGRIAELVFARTREQAKHLFQRKHRRDVGDLTEVPWQTVRLVYRGIDRGAGVMYDDDPQYRALWRLAGVKLKGAA